MEPTQAENPELLASFEGLVVSTQRKFDGIKRYDPEEVQQILRLAVWKALLAWDPAEPRTARRIARGKTERELLEGFVYGCIANRVKDLLKRDRQRELLIEGLVEGNPGFELRYLKEDAEEVYAEAEDSPLVVPSTLTQDERSVLEYLYQGYSGPEIADRLGMPRQRIASCARSIREKMRDWRPRPAEDDEEAASPEPDRSPTPAIA